MNNDIELHIQQNYPWSKIPPTVKQSIGNSQREYEKLVVAFSIKNQLRYKVRLSMSAIVVVCVSVCCQIVN